MTYKIIGLQRPNAIEWAYGNSIHVRSNYPVRYDWDLDTLRELLLKATGPEMDPPLSIASLEITELEDVKPLTAENLTEDGSFTQELLPNVLQWFTENLDLTPYEEESN